MYGLVLFGNSKLVHVLQHAVNITQGETCTVWSAHALDVHRAAPGHDEIRADVGVFPGAALLAQPN